MFLDEKKPGEVVENFKTPADLKINQDMFDALVKVLYLLENEKVEISTPKEQGEINSSKPLKYFNMGWTHCSSVGCIAGWAEQLSDGKAFNGVGAYGGWWLDKNVKQNEPLYELLMPKHLAMAYITTKCAAEALRNYLTEGHPQWWKFA